jgi:hypothetical protein
MDESGMLVLDDGRRRPSRGRRFASGRNQVLCGIAPFNCLTTPGVAAEDAEKTAVFLNSKVQKVRARTLLSDGVMVGIVLHYNAAFSGHRCAQQLRRAGPRSLTTMKMGSTKCRTIAAQRN